MWQRYRDSHDSSIINFRVARHPPTIGGKRQWSFRLPKTQLLGNPNFSARYPSKCGSDHMGHPLRCVIGLLGAENRGIGSLNSASFEHDRLAERSGYGHHGCPAGVNAEA